MRPFGVRAILGLLFRFVFLILLGFGAYVIVENYVPTRHLPWKPPDLTQPPGAATGLQVQGLASNLDQCLASLREAGVEAEPVERMDDGDFCVVENAVRLKSGVTPLSPNDLVMSCPLAAAYVIWDRQVLQPNARQTMGSEVRRLVSYGTYSCRRMYGDDAQRPSEHARANALDIGEIEMADGRRISVKDGWVSGGPESVFLRQLRMGGCQVFGTVLGPDYNQAHHDHLHFDMGQWNFCPTGPSPEEQARQAREAPSQPPSG